MQSTLQFIDKNFRDLFDQISDQLLMLVGHLSIIVYKHSFKPDTLKCKIVSRRSLINSFDLHWVLVLTLCCNQNFKLLMELNQITLITNISTTIVSEVIERS